MAVPAILQITNIHKAMVVVISLCTTKVGMASGFETMVVGSQKDRLQQPVVHGKNKSEKVTGQ